MTIEGIATSIRIHERKDLWKLSDKIVRTRNITQSTVGDRNGLWTSVVAAAVFVDLSDDG